MEALMTKEEAIAYRTRWQALNAHEIEELRAMSPAERLRQAAALMASVDAFGWRDQLASGEDEVRARWMRLRRLLHE